MMTTPNVPVSCSHCNRSIEICECCEEPGCETAVCYGCLYVAVGQTVKQPHDHGG